MARKYSSVAVSTSLTNAISASDTAAVIGSVSGFPASTPFTLVIDPDTALEEIITVNTRSGTSLTSISRGQDGTSAVAHAANAVVKHMATARDFQEVHDHLDATAAHGATGALVGTTNTQTLTNKTINSANNTLTIAQSSVTNLATDLAAKAPLASPGLTGTPTAPTPAVDTNSTHIATTAFVVGQAGSATPVVDGTAAVGTSLRYARQDHVHPTDTTRAPLASPTFTGTVVLPSTTSIGTVDSTEISRLDGVTSNIQTQLDGKAVIVHTHTIGQIGDLTTELASKMSEPSVAGSGLVAFDDTTDVTYPRTLTAGEGITVTNGTGVAGNPTVAMSSIIRFGGGSLVVTSSTTGTVTVTHGLGNTPTAVVASSAMQAYSLSITNMTSTTFDVTARHIDNTSTTTGVSFYWIAAR